MSGRASRVAAAGAGLVLAWSAAVSSAPPAVAGDAVTARDAAAADPTPSPSPTPVQDSDPAGIRPGAIATSIVVFALVMGGTALVGRWRAGRRGRG